MDNQNYTTDSKYTPVSSKKEYTEEAGSKSTKSDISALLKYSSVDSPTVPQSALSSNTHKNINEGIDYEAVMKQFEDLMVELSNSGKMTAAQSKHVDQIGKSCGLDQKCEKSDHYSNKKAVLFSEKAAHSHDSLEADQSGKNEKQPDLNNNALSDGNLDKKSHPAIEERIPWINSYLWDLENKRDPSHFRKSESKSRKNCHRDTSAIDSKDSVLNATPHPIANMSQNTNVSGAYFYLQEVRRKDINYSGYESAQKYDSKTFSYAESHSRGKHMFNPKLTSQGNKIGATTSLIRSPKTSRSPISKYVLPNNCFLVKLYVETKDLHLGPFSFEIYPKMSLRLLKLKVEQEHGIISTSQKWILGKSFAVDNEKSLADYNVLPGSSIIVYVDNKQNESQSKEAKNEKTTVKDISRRNDAVFRKEDRSESFDSSSSRLIHKEMRRLTRKDSLDSKLAKPYSETDVVHNRKLSYHSSDNDSLDMPIKEVKTTSKNIKSPIIKKKVLQKGIASKKKMLTEEKNDLHNFHKSSLLDLERTNHSEKILDCPFFSNELDSATKDKSSGVSVVEVAPENLVFSKQSENVCGVLKADISLNENKIENKANLIDCIKEFDGGNSSCTSEKKVIQSENIDVNKRFDMPVNEEQSIKDLYSSTNCKFKPKTSVTSLIRKLSFARKAKSIDDASCSHSKMSSEAPSEEIAEEKDSNLPIVDGNSIHHNNVHIEILPENQVTIPSENKTVAPCSGANMQGEHHIVVEQELETNTPLEDGLESIKNFELLLEIENLDLVENTTNFTCPVCFDEFESGQGIILHDCLHTFCRECLSNSVSYADGALVKCPYRDDFYSCQSHLQQREIKALVTEDVYEKYLQRSIITAEGLAEQSFHCKTPDCPGWCIYDNGKNIFHCPVCFHYNCLNCQAIHEGLNCRQYQEKLKLQRKVDKESEKTLEFLNKMIESGKALHCPKCDLILMKKWGCDWLKCSVCKTEICWITRGPRWGPGGQGDTSGGCKCGVNGRKCHPSCTYCH